VDETDNASALKDNKNKQISNILAYNLNSHNTKDYDESPHNIDVVDVTASISEEDYSFKNKLISNEIGKKFNDHVEDKLSNGGDVHDQYLRRDGTKHMLSSTRINLLNADLLDGKEGLQYETFATNSVNVHEIKSSLVHGVTGTIVGTTDNQTITNKTINTLNAPITIADGGTNSTSASGARISLGLGTIATYDVDDYVIESDYLDFDYINGSIGFFNTTAPSAQGALTDLTSLSTSGDFLGANTVRLTALYEKIEELQTELQKVIVILKDHGLSS